MRHFQAGEIIAGKFRLQHPLAKGGMGSVWTAWNEQLEVPVAIKFMSAEATGSAELVARFEREAKAAAQMRSPQVVQIYEHGVFNGVPFMVMELLEGEDLGKRLRTRGRLPLPEIARIGTEVCKALRRAHELGIVHRDLKPANVFLARSGDDEVVKVLDFGIAKLLDSAAEATKTGALIGTPNYMSPEQARRSNRKVDHRSDLWSLGVITFRALTGKLPFAGDDPINVLVQICTTAAPAPSSIAPDVGPAADRFFARALASDPDHRFQNARDFAEALNALAAGPTPYPSLGSSWGGEVPPPNPSSPGPARAASQPAYSLPAVSPRAAQPPVARPAAAQRPAHSPHRSPADPFDAATTVPIQRSPAGQAMLAAASSPSAPVPSSPQGSGMSRMPSSPRGFQPPAPGAQPPRDAAPPPGNPPVHGAPAPPHAQAAPLAIDAASPPRPLSSSSSSWQVNAGPAGKPFLRTLPLGMPAAANLPRPPLASTPEPQASVAQGPPRPPAASTSESQAAAPSLFPAAATTSAGESASTITSATGELPARPPRRKTSFIVWGALAAGLIVILVVGSVVVTSMSAAPEPEPTIPLPSEPAPPLRVDTPEPSVTPQPTGAVPTGEAAPSPSSSATADASASGQGAAPPPATPQGTPPKPAQKPKNSVIFGERVF